MEKTPASELLKHMRVTNPASMWAVFGALFVLPLFVSNDYYISIITLCLIFATLASTWNLMVGYAGILSFGHVAFYGLGAYFSALITIHLNISPWLALPLGGLFAAFLSLAIGLPCLRLRIAPYIAIATLAFSEIMLVVCKNWVSLTRGEMGLSGIPPLPSWHLGSWLTVNFGGVSKLPTFYVMLGIYIVSMLTMYWIMNSKVGLALKSLREDQDAAASLGIDITRYKLTVFLVSSFFAGVTGAFYAHYISILSPDSVFGVAEMVEIVAITLVGGIGTFMGPTVGAFSLIVGLELLRGVDDYRFMIYGLMLVLVVLLLPNGLLMGLQQTMARLKVILRTNKAR